MAAAWQAPSPAVAQVAPTVVDGGVENRFPDGMTFRMSAESDSEIQKVRLRYTVLPDGTAASGEPEFQPGRTVSAVFELAGNNPPKIYLAPGTTIDYYWEVTDADGDVGKSAQATFVYEDARFDWTALTQDGVTINFYSGSEDDARDMLAVAAAVLGDMTALIGTAIEFPVKVWIYDSSNDMKPALAKRSETYEQSIVTMGVRVASDTVLVLGNASYDTLRHELTHVVTAVAGESAFGALPAWLDEGTAVYAQEDPGGFGSAIERAIERGNVLSVRSISSYPGEPSKVELFYGQSWSLVTYLVDTYGAGQFAELFAAVKSGKRIEGALEAVFGFGQDGLEDEWRAAMGLPQRETPEPQTPSPAGTGGQPPGGATPAPDADGDGGAPAGLIIGLVVGVIALAGLMGFAGLTIARRYG